MEWIGGCLLSRSTTSSPLAKRAHVEPMTVLATIEAHHSPCATPREWAMDLLMLPAAVVVPFDMLAHHRHNQPG